MFGKYHDSRVYQHFVHTYSKVPYLDSEIFNVETNALRESRRANHRAITAAEGRNTLIKASKEQKRSQNSSPTPSGTPESRKSRKPNSF
jgi:hypothetical protein